jgi:MFS family permease
MATVAAEPIAPKPRWWREITHYQWFILIGTLLGWGLDGFDGNLYALVVGPAVTELLRNSGIANPTPAQIGYYGGLNVTLYLVGWGIGALVLGALADYFGRLRILMASILMYSVFTGLSALAQEWWHLGLFRFLTGLGSGVEWPIGAALIAETWNNRHRAKAAGLMMSGFAMGFFLASAVYGLLGPFGWRAVFAVGILPALLVFFIRNYLHEPEAFLAVKERRRALKTATELNDEERRFSRFIYVQLFTPPLLKHTVLGITMSIGGLFAFWSVTTWVPQIVRDVVASQGITGNAAIPYVTSSNMALNLGGLIGYASWGFIADRLGRKWTLLLSFVTALVGVWALFPFQTTFPAYMLLLPVVGFGIFGFFSGSAVYFPELFPSHVRATACALCNNVGRLITAPGPFVAGILVASFGGSFAIATTIVASTLLVAIVALAFADETRGAFLND